MTRPEGDAPAGGAKGSPDDRIAIVVCRIEAVRYGVRAADVEEIVRAAAVTPLPGAPAVILGLLNLRGAPVPVLDARRRFGHPARALHPDEQFVVARAGGMGAAARRVALRVDGAEALVEVPAGAIEDPRRHVATAAHVEGVVALDDGLLLIHDVARFLARAEAESLDAALDAASSAATGAASGAPVR
jgi:purine-binding chemotaxis protein CheW